jgi:hypothetical protein
LVLGSLFSIFGAGGMVIRSQRFLEHIEPERQAAGSLQVCAMTGALLSVHFFSGAMTAWGVLQGAFGRAAIFERTPKKGTVENEIRALAAVTELER